MQSSYLEEKLLSRRLSNKLLSGDAAFLRTEWDEYLDDYDDPQWRRDSFVFALAPDELHKANVSGGTHDLQLPDTCADPILHGVAGRPGITLTNYLRASIAWGGFPGWSFAPDLAPAALAELRTIPNF